MNEQDDFSQILDTWIDQRASQRLPDGFDQAWRERASRVRQRGSWAARMHQALGIAPSLPGGRSLYVLVGASLLAASIVGAGLTGGSRPSLVPDPLTSSSPLGSPSATAAVAATAGPSPASEGEIAGKFTLTGSMRDERERPSATLLGDGRVLVVGGYGAGGGTSEVYDPATGTFSASGPLAHRRYAHNAILLLDGRVLVVGGMDPNGSGGDGTAVAIADVEVWDPDTDRFTNAGQLSEGRTQADLELQPDGRVLVSGGQVWDGSGSTFTDSAELWDPDTNQITPAPSVPVLLADDRVLATLLDGRVWIITTGSLVSVWDPGTATTTPTGRLVTARKPYSLTATTLADGRVLVVGGRPVGGKIDAVSVAEIWDPRTGEFRTTGSTVWPRRQHSAVALADGRVLVLGNGISAGGMTSAEIFELGGQD